MRSYRLLSAAASVVVFCALVGGFFGRALVAQDQVPDQYRVFTAALAAIEAEYAGEYESDRLIYSAIAGMLQTLDPHSSFMDPRSYAQMRERQGGQYHGLGIQIQQLEGGITVASVFEGSPAHESGMRRGDVIARIEGQDTTGWTTEQAVNQLRGDRGTSVNISLRRVGYDDLIDLRVRRDQVQIRTVRAAAMLDDITGYIRLTDFAETSDAELGRALRDLRQQGMRRLVFDLRANPGGALDQAIRISNRFLPRGSMIVYTRGRVDNADQEYRATETSEYLDLPMITLVNRDSASASEIVAGALQDHDRSLIVGETTFGKALVQSVYNVQNAGAAITTAVYYTPSGRLIQRPWDGTFDEYLTYRLREQTDGPHNPDQLRYTDAGRPVYGGGGIEPDRRFNGPIDGFDPTPFGRLLYARLGVFESFARRFTRAGDTRIAPSSAQRSLAESFEVTDAMLDEFKEHVRSLRVQIDEKAWEQDREFIRAMIRKEIDIDLFSLAVAYQNLAKVDPQLQYALTLFPEAQQLLDSRPALSSTPGRRAER